MVYINWISQNIQQAHYADNESPQTLFLDSSPPLPLWTGCIWITGIRGSGGTRCNNCYAPLPTRPIYVVWALFTLGRGPSLPAPPLVSIGIYAVAPLVFMPQSGIFDLEWTRYWWKLLFNPAVQSHSNVAIKTVMMIWNQDPTIFMHLVQWNSMSMKSWKYSN